MTDETRTLRAAAGVLRTRARMATPGPWTAAWEEGDTWSITGGAHSGMVCPEAASSLYADDAHYIATMHPGVALAFAAWLDAEAKGEVFVGINGPTNIPHSTHTEALAVARAVLGEA